MKKQRIELRLETDLIHGVDHAAEMLKTSRTDVIKTAIRTYLKLNPRGPPQ